MCYHIGIEDLAANALIEALKKGNRRFLTYNEIEEYGSRVIQILNEKEEKAVLILSRDSTNALFRDYSDFFEEVEFEKEKGICLHSEVKMEDLIKQFRGYLALEVLLAFINERSVRSLGA